MIGAIYTCPNEKEINVEFVELKGENGMTEAVLRGDSGCINHLIDMLKEVDNIGQVEIFEDSVKIQVKEFNILTDCLRLCSKKK